MSENDIFLSLGLITIFAFLVYSIYKSIQNEKTNKEIEKQHELYEKKQEEKRIEKRQKESYNWNNKIQSYFNKEIIYKTNKPVKILLGDYHSAMAPLSNSVLKSMGIDTEVVPTASDIIDRIKDGKKYDMIITNNTYKNGECSRDLLELKELEDFNIPIVVLTTETDSRSKFLSYGFDEYIEKPLDEKKLKEVLCKFIKDLKFSKKKSNKS